MPAGVEDRDADVWEALIAVANAAGGDWPRRASEAAKALIKEARDVEPSLGIRLLADLRTVFGAAEHMTTDAILHALYAMPEAPWNDLKGRPLNERGLAHRLRQYEIKSRNIRIGPSPQDIRKGYTREDFYDAWQAYLPQADTSATSATDATNGEKPSHSNDEDVADTEQDSRYNPQTSATSPTDVADSGGDVADDVADEREKNASKSNGVADVADVAPVPAADRDDDLEIPSYLDQRPRCAQCRGRPDGTERPVTVNGHAVWLHDQCRKFYRPEGWSFGFSRNDPMAVMGSSL